MEWIGRFSMRLIFKCWFVGKICLMQHLFQLRSCRCQKNWRVAYTKIWHFFKYIYFIWGWTTSMVIIEPFAPVLELLWLVISRLTFEVFWSEIPRTSEISCSVSSTSELELFWLWDKRCPLGLDLERSSPLELASIVIFFETQKTLNLKSTWLHVSFHKWCLKKKLIQMFKANIFFFLLRYWDSWWIDFEKPQSSSLL